jgi:hypothetical protein
MAKRLAEIEERAFGVYSDLLELRPRQYATKEGNEGEDEIARWWNVTCQAMGKASLAAHILLGYIEERAGADWEALEREREERRGFGSDESADEVVEEAEKVEGPPSDSVFPARARVREG